MLYRKLLFVLYESGQAVVLANLTSSSPSIRTLDLKLNESDLPVEISVDWLNQKLFLVIQKEVSNIKAFDISVCDMGRDFSLTF